VTDVAEKSRAPAVLPGGRAGGRGELPPLVDRLLACVPLLFAAPVLIGIVVSFTRLLSADNPLALTATTALDGQALYLGEGIYNDPASGYTLNLYMPMMAVLLAGLYHVAFWVGWAPILAAVASLAAAGLAARLSHRPAGPSAAGRAFALVEAVGVGGLAWWLAAGVNQSYFFSDKPDSLAWALAFWGLFMVAAGSVPGAPRRRLVLAVLLLTAAFWTKQQAFAASAAAAIWILGATFIGAASPRRAVAFCGGLLAVNVALLGAVNLATDGWQWRLNFEVPSEHATSDAGDVGFSGEVARYAQELAGRALIGAVLLTALLAVARVGVDRSAVTAGSSSASARGARSRGGLAVVVALLTVAGLFVTAASRLALEAVEGGGERLAALLLLAGVGALAVLLPAWILLGVRAGRRVLSGPRAPDDAGPLVTLVALAAVFGVAAAAVGLVAARALGPLGAETFPSLGPVWLLVVAAATLAVASLVAFTVLTAAVALPDLAGRSLRRPRGDHSGPGGVATDGSARGVRRVATRFSSASVGARVATLLVLYVVVGLPFAFYARQKLAAASNQSIGLVWALALLASLAYGVARARGGARRVMGAGIVLAVWIALVSGVAAQTPLGPGAIVEDEGEWLVVGDLYPAVEWKEVPGEIVGYSRDHRVYPSGNGAFTQPHQGAFYQEANNFLGLLAVGLHPGQLERDLLGRRIDAVVPFPADDVDYSLQFNEGRGEEGYLWKLNEVIEAKYAARPGTPPGLLARRPGADPAPWMNDCFGPYRLGGSALRAYRGGGFWCRDGKALELRRALRRHSDFITQDRVNEVSGVVGASLGARGEFFDLRLVPRGGKAFRLRGERTARGIKLRTSVDGETEQRELVPGRGRDRAVELELTQDPDDPGALDRVDPGRVRVALPGGSGFLRLGASRDSGARFELAGLRAR